MVLAVNQILVLLLLFYYMLNCCIRVHDCSIGVTVLLEYFDRDGHVSGC